MKLRLSGGTWLLLSTGALCPDLSCTTHSIVMEWFIYIKVFLIDSEISSPSLGSSTWHGLKWTEECPFVTSCHSRPWVEVHRAFWELFYLLCVIKWHRMYFVVPVLWFLPIWLLNFFAKTVLLTNNLCIIKFIHLRCTIEWFLVNFQNFAIITTIQC